MENVFDLMHPPTPDLLSAYRQQAGGWWSGEDLLQLQFQPPDGRKERGTIQWEIRLD